MLLSSNIKNWFLGIFTILISFLILTVSAISASANPINYEQVYRSYSSVDLKIAEEINAATNQNIKEATCKSESRLIDYRNRGKGVEAAAAKGGSNIALGVTEHLDDFARSVNGSTWKTWGAQDFQTQFMSTINNSANKIHFNMTGPSGTMLNPWKAVTEGARGLGSSRATSWELFQLYSNPGALQRTTFYFNGKVIPSPF